jgi:hypothetical protein
MSQPWHLPATGWMPRRQLLELPSDSITDAGQEEVGLELDAAILEKP